jgi:DNA-directed RNA polymerase subunit RPC12/RpoP
MPEYQKRHIAVSPQERRQLEEGKEHYENRAGQTDWGTFLGVATGIGLAALGIYALARASQRNATTWQVTCPNRNCGATFPLVTQAPPRLAQVTCPSCNSELVVDFGRMATPPNGSEGQVTGVQPGETIRIYCAHCSREMEVAITGGASWEGVTYLQCPFCGGVATYGIGQAEPQT